MRKWAALDLGSHHRAHLVADSWEWLYARRRRLALSFANCMMLMTTVLVDSGRVMMVRRVFRRYVAGHVCVSGARDVANRRRERRRDQYRCDHE